MEYLDTVNSICNIAGDIEDIIKSKWGSMTAFYDRAGWTATSWNAFKSGKADFPRHYINIIPNLFTQEDSSRIKEKISTASTLYRLRIKSKQESFKTLDTFNKYFLNYDENYPFPAFFVGCRDISNAFNHFGDEMIMSRYLRECCAPESLSYPNGLTADMLSTQDRERAFESIKRLAHESFWIMIELDGEGTGYKNIIGIRDFGGMEQTRVSEYMFVDNILPLEVEYGTYRRTMPEDIHEIILDKIEQYNQFLQKHNLEEEVLIYDDYYLSAVTMLDGKRSSVTVSNRDGKWYIEEFRNIKFNSQTENVTFDIELIPVENKKITHISKLEKKIFIFR